VISPPSPPQTLSNMYPKGEWDEDHFGNTKEEMGSTSGPGLAIRRGVTKRSVAKENWT
jgi:hypothetical protein